MNRPVRISRLAALDLQQARDWFDQREEGLGDSIKWRCSIFGVRP